MERRSGERAATTGPRGCRSAHGNVCRKVRASTGLAGAQRAQTQTPRPARGRTGRIRSAWDLGGSALQWAYATELSDIAESATLPPVSSPTRRPFRLLTAAKRSRGRQSGRPRICQSRCAGSLGRCSARLEVLLAGRAVAPRCRGGSLGWVRHTETAGNGRAPAPGTARAGKGGEEGVHRPLGTVREIVAGPAGRDRPGSGRSPPPTRGWGPGCQCPVEEAFPSPKRGTRPPERAVSVSRDEASRPERAPAGRSYGGVSFFRCVLSPRRLCPICSQRTPGALPSWRSEISSVKARSKDHFLPSVRAPRGRCGPSRRRR